MDIVLMGGGRYAGMLYSMFSDQVNFIGYLDDVYDHAYVEEHYPLKKLGDSKDLDRIYSKCNNICIAIGSEGDTSVRTNYFRKFREAGFSFPALVHPSGILSGNALVDIGTVVQFDVVINPMAQIGKNCVISTKAMVGHDVVLGDNVYISPGVLINGATVVGDNTFLGTGAIVIQKRKIGCNCIVGAGACVTRDIDDGTKVVGVPAKPVIK